MTLGAIFIAVALGCLVWYVSSYWIAYSIIWLGDRRPDLSDSRWLKAWEVATCSALFLACLALAFWLARLLSEK